MDDDVHHLDVGGGVLLVTPEARRVQLLETGTGAALGPPLEHDADVTAAAFASR